VPSSLPPTPSPGHPRPGPRSRRLFHEEQALIAPGQQRISLLSELALDHGAGATVTDLDGNTYIDFFAGVTVASLGHAHPRYVAAVEAQLRRLAVGSFATESRRRLLAMSPGFWRCDTTTPRDSSESRSVAR
jgi:4-aminobutyrate aminotransferase-like enzyme